MERYNAYATFIAYTACLFVVKFQVKSDDIINVNPKI